MSPNRSEQRGGGNLDAAPDEIVAELVRGAIDPLLRGVFPQAERGRHFADGAIFKETQHDGVAFLWASRIMASSNSGPNRSRETSGSDCSENCIKASCSRR